MNIYDLGISDVKIIESDVYEDHRGYLSVPVSVVALRAFGIEYNIVQINQGYSKKAHTIRGMHFQTGSYEQAKLVSANYGSLYSVAVDIRKNSSHFGQWCGEVISVENHKVMYVPRGFAHGYLTLEPGTILQYCVDNEYNSEAAKALRFDDPDVGIQWPCMIDKTTLTNKDLNACRFKDLI